MSVDDVRAAAERLAGRVVRTPVLRSPALDALAGAELWLKAECLQRIGAFKARGALHAVGRMSPETRSRGVITFSSGNHAQAVALAAREFGVPATIAMPVDAPAVKVAGVRALGAEIVFAGTTSEERRAAALAVRERTGGAIVDPFDDADIIAGQGTATLELVEEVLARGSKLDALVVPVGGGGLIAGACLVAEAADIAVYSAEPGTCNALARSLRAGERVAVQPGSTLADGLKPVRVGEQNFAVASRVVRGSFEVDDDALGRALVALLLHAKVLVEPSGAAGLAAALSGALRGRRVGVLLSGGNVEPSLVAELLGRHAGQA
ncbi:threonine ammonia-lyase [Nannocystis punicea]|uniref:Threonine/serine dehydratase n=1 Tax=Nannocystis punicea TaxID=2995304 RepID=A0ABY7HJP1_9BACT|nr:threonine/serine dehydratase [Nannocystis poenicansa]WAS99568.1 threonine/serine dehydratase [Nannocystis poenicansa]